MDILVADENFFRNVYSNYWNGTFIFILYLLSLLYIIKTDCGLKKWILGYPFLLSVFIVFVPWINLTIVKKLSLESRYYRFYWMFPIALTLGIVLIELINRKKNMPMIFLLVCVLLFVCSFEMRGIYEHKTMYDNIYKVNDEVVEISKIIHNHSKEEQVIAYYGMNLMSELRTYDASIISPLGRIQSGEVDEQYLSIVKDEAAYRTAYSSYDVLRTMIFEELEYSPNIVYASFSEYGIDCFIREKALFSDEYIKSLHFEKIGETELYEVYWCTPYPAYLANFNIDSKEIVIPGVQDVYHFVVVNDMHIICESEEILPEEKNNIQSRKSMFISEKGIESANNWKLFCSEVDKLDADAVLLNGDILDFFSVSNYKIMEEGLNRINTPFMYLRADHDYFSGWTNIQDDTINELENSLDGNFEIQELEYDKFIILGINNNTSQISSTALEKIQKVFEKNKSIIIVSHVPYDLKHDSSLASETAKMWEDRVLLWGKGDEYEPNENTQKLMDMIYEPDSPVVAIVGAHLHFPYTEQIDEKIVEYVFDASYKGKIGYITVHGVE